MVKASETKYRKINRGRTKQEIIIKTEANNINNNNNNNNIAK